MKNILSIVILICVNFTVKSQVTRYFEFRQTLGQPIDSTYTSFITAASDTTVINSVLNDLMLPIANRRFISGIITNGAGGFNHDGTNWHSWHFITNEWQLTAANIEFCDGISSLIGNHPSIIAGDSLYFCPWDSYPFQEVYNPSLSVEDLNSDIQITIYSNPSTNKVYFKWESSQHLLIDIYNITGQRIFTTKLSKQNNDIDISNLYNGLYFVHLTDGNKREKRKIIVKN